MLTFLLGFITIFWNFVLLFKLYSPKMDKFCVGKLLLLMAWDFNSSESKALEYYSQNGATYYRYYNFRRLYYVR
jgi:hypothetical protein